MNEFRSEAETHRLVGGALCLDFSNTVSGHGHADAHEYLHDYRDLALWCCKAGALMEREADGLIQAAARQPGKAAAAFKRALALRETIYRLFSAIAHGRSPEAADLDQLNQARAEALARSRVARTAQGFEVKWDDEVALDRVLWPITLSAVELLTSGDAGRARECAGEDCDWLFLDTSRNHLRRWCSMDECGNRAKSRRFFERKKKGRSYGHELDDAHPGKVARTAA